MDSCGLLLYRINDGVLEVLIAHMGGPFWERKQLAAWSIPKGLAEAGETDLLAVAEREFTEEMGSAPVPGPTAELGSVKSGKKTIHVFARPGSFDVRTFHSNEFEMEWPKGSGKLQSFPEVDSANWVTTAVARDLLVKSQVEFLDRLIAILREKDDQFDLETPEPPTLFG